MRRLPQTEREAALMARQFEEDAQRWANYDEDANDDDDDDDCVFGQYQPPTSGSHKDEKGGRDSTRGPYTEQAWEVNDTDSQKEC